MVVTWQDKLLAVVRTAAAAAAGSAIAWAAVHWHVVLSPASSAWAVNAVVVLATAGYLAAASWLQRAWPGWCVHWPALARLTWLVSLLLLSSQQPTYVPAHMAGGPARSRSRRA